MLQCGRISVTHPTALAATARTPRKLLAVVLLLSAIGCGDDPVTSITVAEAPLLNVADGDEQEGFPNETLPDSIRVRAVDASGRPRAGVRVEWSVTEGGGSLQPGSSVTNATGHASAAWRLGANSLNQASARIVGTTRSASFEARASGFTFACGPTSFESRPGDLRVIGCGASSVGGFLGTLRLESDAMDGLGVAFVPDSVVLGAAGAIGESLILLDVSPSLGRGDYVLTLRASTADRTVAAPLDVRIR
jgi:hypothetical protein